MMLIKPSIGVKTNVVGVVSAVDVVELLKVEHLPTAYAQKAPYPCMETHFPSGVYATNFFLSSR
jgi:hypothetical protein